MGLELQTVLLARQLESASPPSWNVWRRRWRAMTAAPGTGSSPWCVCTDPRRTVPASNSGPAAAPRIGLGQGGRDDAPLRQDEHADFVADAVRPVTELVSAIAELVRSQAP